MRPSLPCAGGSEAVMAVRGEARRTGSSADQAVRSGRAVMAGARQRCRREGKSPAAAVKGQAGRWSRLPFPTRDATEHDAMASITRKASAHWEGDLKTGQGKLDTPQSGLLAGTRYGFNTRFGGEKGTN